MSGDDSIAEGQPLRESSDRDDNSIDIPPVVGHGCYTKLFPFGFFYEFRMLFRLAVPIALTSLINYAFGPVSVIFCGHLSALDLATVGLAISVFNVTGLAIIMGLLTACDTLFSQVYGSGNLNHMGLNLQRCLILTALCCLPCWSLHLLMEPLLLILKQNPLISKQVTLYLTYMMPSLLFVAGGQIFTKYVQAQNRTIPALIIGVIVNVVNAVLHYLLLFVAHMRIKGSAIAQSTSYFIQTALFVLYTKWHPMSKTTWINYRKAVFDDWGLWFRLALPGLLMISLEWTIFEIGSIVAGVLGARELAAQSIIYNIESLFYTLLPLGIGSAASIRVGHFLGARSVVGPRSVTSVSLIVMCLLSTPTVVTFTTLQFQIPRIFTHDEQVIYVAGKLLPILAVFQFLDGIEGVCSGIVRGAGLQYVGAVICCLSFYVFGAPIGMGLIFGAHYGIEGLWYGLCIGVFLSASAYVIVCVRLDWLKQVQLAMLRVNPVAFDRHVTRVSTVSQINEELKHNTSVRHLDPPSPETRPLLVSHRERKSYLTETDEMKVRETRNLRSRKRLLNCGGRISFAMTLLSLFFASLLCRLFVCWSEYFGVYCVYNNGTFLNFSNEMELARFLNDSIHNTNCTVVIP